MRPKSEYSRFNEHGTFVTTSHPVQAIELDNHQVVVISNPSEQNNGTSHNNTHESTGKEGYNHLQENVVFEEDEQ